MSTLFSKIVAGEIPSHKVYEDEDHFAFLDINPLHAGHTLVIPKQEVDYLFDLEGNAYTALWNAVRVVEAAVRKATGCARVIVNVQGYEIAHAHVHLIPTNRLEDYVMPPRRGSSDPDDLATMAARIRDAL